MLLNLTSSGVVGEVGGEGEGDADGTGSGGSAGDSILRESQNRNGRGIWKERRKKGREGICFFFAFEFRMVFLLFFWGGGGFFFSYLIFFSLISLLLSFHSDSF